MTNGIPFMYNDGGRKDAGLKGEKAGDCVCRAIAIVTGLPYTEVWDKLAAGNEGQRITKRTRASKKSMRKAGVKTADRGITTRRKWFDDYMTALGFKWVPTMQIGQGCKTHLRENELPKGRLVVNVSKHFTAVINGVLNDTYDCSREGTRCVYGYYIWNP